ncbi:MAG TPA: 50S ribosome-binding GTPase, partial [Pirellulaceae bacterium]|nr:50S ribosome-binding GTPase [Pirellulaceae bacterium]
TGGDARGLTSLIDHDTRYVPYLCLGGIALMAERPSVAVLTPAGRGAVATVGVWGPAATQLVESCFQSASGRRLADTPLDRVLFGSWNGAEELVLARRGDERLEIHCHGGLAASEAIVESLVERGARRAAPSEWLTSGGLGRIEVEAAEALARAQTERTAAILLDQYRGALRREITELIELIASIKKAEPAEPTEHVARVETTRASSSASAVELRSQLEQLVARAKLGVRLTDPWRVVLTGKPNVGKSSLINALLGYERAIVSDVPGTTRDVVTATTALDGWPITLADTAGRRATDEPLEASGIELAVHRLSEADLVLLVVDHDGPFDAEESAILARHPAALVVRNKCDLATAGDRDCGPGASNAARGDRVAIRVSATTAAGLDLLQAAIVARLVPQPISEHAAVPFTARQIGLLEQALAASRASDCAHCDESLLALVERL